MSEQQSTFRSTGAGRVETTTPGATSTPNATGRSDLNSSTAEMRAAGRRRNDRIISASGSMQAVVDQASGIARSDDFVLLGGPSGVGRKHVARAIHQWSSRAGGPLVELQLTGLSEAAQSRELFGDGTTAGGLSRAQGGTLILDGADELGPNLLTRVAEALRSAGTGAQRPRLLATATAATPGAGTDRGQSSLSALGGHRIEITALTERTEDILPLAAHFLAEFAAEESVEPIGFSADARRWLIEETWTGNVRELRERIRQAIRLAGQGAISAEALMLSTEGDEVPSFKDAKRAFETRYVEGLLRRCSGNISRAARMAKKDRKDFYDVIRRTGVDPGEFRG